MKSIPVRKILKEESKPGTESRFRIRPLENILAGKKMVQELHRHNFFFILAVEHGQGNHSIDFVNYKVQNRSIFILRPGQVHVLTLQSHCTGYLLEFNPEFYHIRKRITGHLLRRVFKTNFYEVSRNTFQKLNCFLEYILDEYQNKKDGFEEAIKANLDIFFIELSRQRINKKDTVVGIHAYQQERLDHFLDLLEGNLHSKMKVSDFARMMNMSVYQLNHMTRSGLGKIASKVINDHMILEARRQLLATSVQVSQVAYSLGFEDSSYFIRYFKKHTGYSPEAYRLNFK